MFKGLFKNTRDKGEHYERLAKSYLQKQGLNYVQSNYYCSYGEIDLIMRDGNCWVFVEVKYRTSHRFGGALAALGQAKQQKLKRSIYHYLGAQQLHNVPVRVDFIAIEGKNPPNIQWIKSVF
ncbi:YraN family protein [Pseudoalteromonas sp. S16_S37]